MGFFNDSFSDLASERTVTELLLNREFSASIQKCDWGEI